MTDPGAASADGQALAHLRSADPVLARVIDAHAGFDARTWLRELPAMDAFGALIFMVTGQQLSVRSAQRILGRLADLFGGQLPSPAVLLAADPGDLLKTGLSRRKAATLRTLAAHGVRTLRTATELRLVQLRALNDAYLETVRVVDPKVFAYYLRTRAAVSPRISAAGSG